MTLANGVYETIKAEIITCRLKPGDQIAQSHLAKKYSVGTTPVREALLRLAQEGYVEPIPRFGYVVRPVTVSDVREIFEIRTIIEAEAARLAALRASREHLDKIVRAADLSYVYTDRESYWGFLEHNTQFHLLIAEASGNRRLTELVRRQLDELTRLYHLGLNWAHDEGKIRQEHLIVAHAIRASDPEGARQAVLSTMACSQSRILQGLIEDNTAPAFWGAEAAIQIKPPVP